jgi:protein MpaA
MIFSNYTSGSSVEKNPIECLVSEVTGKKYLYLLAGIHGDEVEAIYLLQQLTDWLSEEHSMQDIPIVILPMLNPDGYKRQLTENSHGVDLNATFPWNKTLQPSPQTFMNEPEQQYLLQVLKKFPPGIVLNFMSMPSAMITFEGDACPVASFFSKLNSYPMRSEKIFDRGTLCHFMWHYYQAPVVNFITPHLSEHLSLHHIWEHNYSTLRKFFFSDLPSNYVS